MKSSSAAQVVDAVLAAERDADLIVLSGDMVSGFKNRYSRPGWFEKQCAPSGPADSRSQCQRPHGDQRSGWRVMSHAHRSA